jgi:hypothetical protein
MLLSGAAEFGVLFFQYIELRDAAQEGALYASTHPLVADITEIENRVKSSSDKPIPLDQAGIITITISVQDLSGTSYPSTDTTNFSANNCEGHAITVLVHYDHIVFMPFMTRWIGQTVPLNATVTDTILSPYSCTADP